MNRLASDRFRAATLLATHGATADALLVAIQGLRATRSPCELEARIAARGEIREEREGDRALLRDVLGALDDRKARGWRESLVQASAVVVLAGYLAIKLLHPFGVRAVASAEFDLAHRAANAADGRDATEWLLPDNSPGWIELRFQPRKVKALRVLNASNRPGPDRAVVAYEIEVFDGDALQKTVTGTLGPFQMRPTWRTIPLEVSRATRVRLHVRSWAGAGGGLAELVLE